MARRLLEESESNEWFRLKVAERLADSAESSDPHEEAGRLFLLRPQGWEARLSEIAESLSESVGDHERDQLRQRIAALEAELDTTRNRAKRAQREIEMLRAESDKRVTAARSSARAGRDSDHQALEAAKRDNATLSTDLASVTQERDETRARLKQIRQELLRERRIDRPTEAPPPKGAWADLDALGAARLLDEVATALAPSAQFVEQMLPLEHAPLVLPSGVAPDDGSAIAWLATRRQPYVLVVDGYNVTFLMYPDRFNAADSRQRLNGDLARFRRTSVARPRVVVVYDSDQTGGITSDSAPGGIDVRFTTADHSADDEVLLMATELGGSAVVVSTDRRVREGAERVGALGLWSQALVGWIKT